MSNDTIEVRTPTGKTVMIRNYTTHGDDRQAQALLDGGMNVSSGKDNEPVVTFSMAATTASEAKYVELLVQSIDGSSDDVQAQLDALRSDDYAAVQEAVKGITSVPKAPTTSKS